LSYHAQALLTSDATFQGRSYSAAVQQAAQFDDALSAQIRRGDSDVLLAFVRLNAAGPGIADKVDQGDGTIDQSLVTDADLLSLTQANWPIVAALYPSAP